jgi:hypothetical protein
MCMNCKLMLTLKLGTTKVESVCVRWVDVNEILASVLLTSVQAKNVQTRVQFSCLLKQMLDYAIVVL